MPLLSFLATGAGAAAASPFAAGLASSAADPCGFFRFFAGACACNVHASA
jgi:hypothetical protein